MSTSSHAGGVETSTEQYPPPIPFESSDPHSTTALHATAPSTMESSFLNELCENTALSSLGYPSCLNTSFDSPNILTPLELDAGGEWNLFGTTATFE